MVVKILNFFFLWGLILLIWGEVLIFVFIDLVKKLFYCFVCRLLGRGLGCRGVGVEVVELLINIVKWLVVVWRWLMVVWGSWMFCWGLVCNF